MSDHEISGGIFAGLAGQELSRISRQCHWRSYAAGAQVLAHQDAQAAGVLFVQRGRVRVLVYSQSGREVIFRSAGPGEIIGDFAAIDGGPRSAEVLAQEDTLVAEFSADVFLDLLAQYPSAMRAELRALTANIRALTERVTELSTQAMGKRLQAFLLRLAESTLVAPSTDQARVDALPTHAEIAATIGSHREAVTKELSRLEQAGVIVRVGRSLGINLRRLKAELAG